jgi:hypothetical protein
MLLCKDIAIRACFPIIRAAVLATPGRKEPPLRIIPAMTDADELARRFFSLWAEYLTALVADPQAAELLQRWVAFTSQFAKNASERPGNSIGNPFGSPFPIWPPLAAGFAAPGSTAAAASAAGASGERGDAVGELARRIGELERRLAALEGESRPAARRPRRGNRPSGK